MAARATFALKAGLCVRRARLAIVTPDMRHSRRSQADFPLIGLSEFAQPPLPTWRALEKLRARLTRRLIASGRQLVADKPVLRAMLRAMWRQLRNRGWGASRSSLH